MGAILGGIDAAWLVQGGAVTLLGVVVTAILRGWLVPRRTVDTMAKQWEAQARAAERREEYWRQAHATAAAQVDALMVIGRVAEQTLRALPTSEPAGGSGA